VTTDIELAMSSSLELSRVPESELEAEYPLSSSELTWKGESFGLGGDRSARGLRRERRHRQRRAYEQEREPSFEPAKTGGGVHAVGLAWLGV
jgi:hypothetical protein